MAVIGIDPGIDGAIALVTKCQVWVEDMPVMSKTSGKGRQVDARNLSSIIDEFIRIAVVLERDPVKAVSVENVSSMPGQGVSSVFSFGKSAGIIEGVLGCKDIGVYMVTPAVWKRRMGLTGKDKEASRAKCIREHPGIAGSLARKKDSDRAEAILIARYWGEKHGER